MDKRGLLIDMPSATYLFGTEELYDWADGKPILRGIEYTHDLTRLSRGASRSSPSTPPSRSIRSARSTSKAAAKKWSAASAAIPTTARRPG